MQAHSTAIEDYNSVFKHTKRGAEADYLSTSDNKLLHNGITVDDIVFF